MSGRLLPGYVELHSTFRALQRLKRMRTRRQHRSARGSSEAVNAPTQAKSGPTARGDRAARKVRVDLGLRPSRPTRVMGQRRSTHT